MNKEQNNQYVRKSSAPYVAGAGFVNHTSPKPSPAHASARPATTPYVAGQGSVQSPAEKKTAFFVRKGSQSGTNTNAGNSGAGHHTRTGNRSGRPFSRDRGPQKKNGIMRKVTSEGSKKFDHVIPNLKDGDIRIIPLGGAEEIGKNMTAIEFKDEIIVIDAGIQFKTEETPGIDYMLPNTKYLEARKGKIKALVITHGHLDHIGGIPYVIEAMGNPPIYTREFGALLIKKRMSEFPHIPELNIKIKENTTFTA